MNDVDLTTKLAEQVEALHEEYAASFVAKSVDIAVAWSKADRDSMDEDAIAELGSRLHRLAGSAGSFGFSEIGELASETETLLNNALDAGSPGWEAARLESSTRIERLVKLLQAQPS